MISERRLKAFMKLRVGENTHYVTFSLEKEPPQKGYTNQFRYLRTPPGDYYWWNPIHATWEPAKGDLKDALELVYITWLMTR